MLLKDNTVLMALRNEEECPDAHMKWEFPGGKVDFGETPQESLQREFLEETGITVRVKELLPFVQTSYWDYEWGKQQTLCFLYLCELVKQDPIVEKDHHIEEIRWIPLDEVSKLSVLPGTHEAISLAREAVNSHLSPNNSKT